MNEIDLIKEVEKRPILYDKSVSGFNKTKLRDDAWKEVQEALNVSESECKKRWRSLRDSFIKLQRTHGGRTRWPYHHAMRFLLPHVEPKLDTGTVKRDEDSEPEEDFRPEIRPEVRQDVHSDNRHEAHPEIRSEVRPEVRLEVRPVIRQRSMPSLPDLSFPAQEIKQYEEEDDSPPSPKKARINSTEEENPCQCNRTDPDELFLLSCAPIMKRLNAKQNAGVRLKIQQVLYEAEFGAQMELPYVTPASECGYDNTESSVE